MSAVADRVLDARFMEPPGPFVRTLEILDELLPGQRLQLLLYREPHPLFRTLAQSGHVYTSQLQPDGTFEILIWKAPD
jgi:tRNA 2-thiouridine synthesizing protein A